MPKLFAKLHFSLFYFAFLLSLQKQFQQNMDSVPVSISGFSVSYINYI